MKTLKQRIENKIIKLDNGCWQWQGAKHYSNNKIPYGQLRISRTKLKMAHIISYEVFIGKIPAKMDIDHLCKNTLCVNPKHLEAVSHKINCQRRKDSGLPHCIYGHKYTKKTSYFNSKGYRKCKICRVLRSRKYRKKMGIPVRKIGPKKKDPILYLGT
jgi:hypothetical protein